jgi:trimeric autotransporter adhesin
MFTGRKLALTLAFTILVALASGVSCRGFFVNPTLTSITVNPTAPSVQVGTSTTLQAYGVYSDGTGNYLTSGVSWSSSDITIATVTGSGSASLTGVATGTATITASSESVTSTASATVFIVVSALGITPTSNSEGENDDTATYVVYANNNQQNNVSSGAQVLVYQGGTQVTTIACTYDSVGNDQVCSASNAVPGTYQLVASYPGTTITATATLVITNSP